MFRKINWTLWFLIYTAIVQASNFNVRSLNSACYPSKAILILKQVVRILKYFKNYNYKILRVWCIIFLSLHLVIGSFVISVFNKIWRYKSFDQPIYLTEPKKNLSLHSQANFHLHFYFDTISILYNDNFIRVAV